MVKTQITLVFVLALGVISGAAYDTLLERVITQLWAAQSTVCIAIDQQPQRRAGGQEI